MYGSFYQAYWSIKCTVVKDLLLGELNCFYVLCTVYIYLGYCYKQNIGWRTKCTIFMYYALFILILQFSKNFAPHSKCTILFQDRNYTVISLKILWNGTEQDWLIFATLWYMINLFFKIPILTERNPESNKLHGHDI